MRAGGDYSDSTQFKRLVARADDIQLVALLFEFAADAYPDLDPRPYLAELDRLSQEAARRVAARRGESLATRLGELSQYLFVEEGFAGDERTYHDPRNSYLHEVLDRRRGLPISLTIVHQHVAAAAGLNVYGVGTPGHFIAGCTEGDETLFVDPFHGGKIFDRDGCRDHIERILSRPGALADFDFAPATPFEIGLRVLRNLKTAYVMADEWSRVVPVQRRLCAMVPDVAEERRDLGLMCLRAGDPQEALRLLERFLKSADGPRAEEVAPYVRAARRMVAELN